MYWVIEDDKKELFDLDDESDLLDIKMIFNYDIVEDEILNSI